MATVEAPPHPARVSSVIARKAAAAMPAVIGARILAPHAERAKAKNGCERLWPLRRSNTRSAEHRMPAYICATRSGMKGRLVGPSGIMADAEAVVVVTVTVSVTDLLAM